MRDIMQIVKSVIEPSSNIICPLLRESLHGGLWVDNEITTEVILQ